MSQDGRAFFVSLSLVAIVILYLLLAGILIAQRPGLHYDEALSAVMPVHLLQHHGRGEFPLAQDPHTWVTVAGRTIPLMQLRYVGAAKEYLMLPAMALFGPKTSVLRLCCALLGALCIWGIGRLLIHHWSPAAGLAAAFLLAVNPSFLDQTIFDHGEIAMTMAIFGLTALALDAYLRKPALRTALLLGVALGLGVWARANFLWFAGPLVLAVAVVVRRWPLLPWRDTAAIAGGGLLGSLPFWIYQIVSRGGTWQAVGMFSDTQPLAAMLPARVKMLALALISNAEHRAMWGGGEVPAWEYWLCLLLVAGGAVVCLWPGERPKLAPIAALTLLGYAALLLTLRMQIAEHHLVGLLPLAAVVVVCGFSLLSRRWKAVGVAARAVTMVYLCICVYWLSNAVMGLARTGGVGPWSDAIVEVTAELESKHAGRHLTILDWGLANGIYVLSRGAIVPTEVYDVEHDRATWLNAFRNGGLYLINGAGHRFFPGQAANFLAAVAQVGAAAHRTPFLQRNGEVFAELIAVDPVDPANIAAPPAGTTVLMKDPAAAPLLEGFHEIEQGGWRWTSRNFTVQLTSPDPADRQPLRLVCTFYVPEGTLRAVGPVTLAARVGTHQLAPVTWSTDRQVTYIRDIPAGALSAAGNRVHFTLDKAIPPTGADRRELGLIAISAALEQR